MPGSQCKSIASGLLLLPINAQSIIIAAMKIHRFDLPELQAGGCQAELAQACGDCGFFYLGNHGLDRQLRDDVLQSAGRFFELPGSAKESIGRSYHNPFGYYDRELTKNRRDQKEIFDFTNPEGVEDSPFGGMNQWPEKPAGFRETMESYFGFCTELSATLLRLIGNAFVLPADPLAAAHKEHSSFARLNYYPVVDSRTQLLGIHPHSDAGTLAVLLQDENPGLDMDVDGRWESVPPAGDALVINMGDMLTVWSNDRIHAPVHRVRPSTRVPRISLPYFYNPGYATRIQPLSEGPPRYRPFTWAEFRRRRADGDFGDYGSEVQIGDYRRQT